MTGSEGIFRWWAESRRGGHRTPGSPGSAPRSVNKNQKLSKRNVMRKYSGTEAKPKGLWRSLAAGHQAVKDLIHNYRLLVGKEID